MRAGVPSAASRRVGAHERRRPPQPQDVEHRAGNVDRRRARHLLLDERHREQRREVIGPDRFLRARMQRRLQRLGQIGQRVVPSGRDRVLAEHEASVHHDLRFTGAAPRSRTRPAGSSARTSASPTSTASNPTAPRRAESAGERTADSAMPITAGGSNRGEPLAHAEVFGERREVPIVDADDRRARRQRPLDLSCVVGLDEHRESRTRPRPRAGRRAATGRATRRR